MATRALVIVGGGSSSRFGRDKLLEDIAGEPLVKRTISAVVEHVDTCVLVTRAGLVATMQDMDLGVRVVAGGSTRTQSEIAGLASLDHSYDLIGIHDAARPSVHPRLLQDLFETAERVGGAVPVRSPDTFLVDKARLRPIDGPVRVQTPQVFRGPLLMEAYARAETAEFDGHDTVEVMHRFSEIQIEGVPGDPMNIKVTYPDDLDKIRRRFEGPSRTGAR